MKKKNVIKITVWSIILLLIAFSFIKLSTTIYIGNSSCSYGNTAIDIQIKIDDKLVLDDSLNYNPFEYITIDKKLKYGIHKLKISSKVANVNIEKNILLLPNQYIYIEFYPKTFSEEEKSTFIIESRFNPFYYE